MNQHELAQARHGAATKALDQFVHNGLKIGLGSGSTAGIFVRALGERVNRDGLRISATATSSGTTEIARLAGLELSNLNAIGELDVTVDGADEIDHNFNMIKGGGACLLWEKIVARSSKQVITICDETKIVATLGQFPLAVEVVQFGYQQTQRVIKSLLANLAAGNEISLRQVDGQPLITDSGNFILDCHCRQIADPSALENALNNIPGVVDNGLFTREASAMVVGRADGSATVTMRNS